MRTGPKTSPCKGCHRQIVWLLTENGKATPVDPKVLTVIDAHGKTVKGRQTHFATCPDRERFRKGK